MEITASNNKIIDETLVSSALRDRKIYFNTDVNRHSIFKAIQLIDRIVTLDKKTNTKEDIEIILDCEGGYIYSGLALLSKIISLKNDGYKVITTVNSFAMSMGFMISVVGSHRRALKYSTFMIHQPSSAAWGCLQDMEQDVEEINRLWNTMKEIIIEYTSMTDEMLEQIKLHKKDKYMSSEEALNLGVIDSII